jgi:hypothetical protein
MIDSKHQPVGALSRKNTNLGRTEEPLFSSPLILLHQIQRTRRPYVDRLSNSRFSHPQHAVAASGGHGNHLAAEAGAWLPLAGATRKCFTYDVLPHVGFPFQDLDTWTFYVNDVVVFVAPIKEDIWFLVNTLASFWDAVGLSTNYQKSLVAPISCEDIDLDDILQYFPATWELSLCDI